MAARSFTVTAGTRGSVTESAGVTGALMTALSDAVADVATEIGELVDPPAALTDALAATEAALAAVEAAADPMIGDNDVSLLVDATDSPTIAQVIEAIDKIKANLQNSNLFTPAWYADND